MSEKNGRVVGAGLMVVAGLAAAGCGDSSGPAWSGSQASVSLEWTVNGLAASTDICNRAGTAFVVLWASAGDPGCGPGTEGCGDALESWVWGCASGTADSGLVFRTGSVWLTWGITAADGRLREATSWQEANLHAGNNGFTFNFTPGWSGTPDATLVGTWTLGGQPASAANCTAAGAENVRLSYRLPGGAATTTQWPCAAGTGDTGSIFRGLQRYELMWELLDAADAALAVVPATGWQSLTMASGNNPVALDFAVSGPDASVEGTWTIGGAAADATTCGDANAETVRLSWRATGTTAETTVEWPCADGTGATDTVFESGTSYDLAWDLLDDAGDSLVRIDWDALTPVAGTNAVPVDFLVGGALDVTLEWADKTVGPAWGACDLPPDPVAEIGYRLEDATSGDVLEEVDIATAPIACTVSLAFTDLPFASYRLIVDGRAASPATAAWHAECTALEVDAVTGSTATCQVAMTLP